ncbi:MAG: trigger factor [Lachnospiraceae bacterium]|nr:trigger factor [Lachnospiraceae bacterium]
MKKKLCVTAVLMLMMAVLCGCGGVNPDKYVTLGNYKELSVEVTYMTFTEEDLQNSIEQELKAYIDIYDMYDYEPIVSANTVEQGSIVNIDYEGTIDGQIFAGGSAEQAHLEIGSGRFIEGFEEGLVGKSVGENVVLNLTFPEDYNIDFAGKDVVFSVSINSIDERKDPEYNDELIVALNMGETITTFEDYKNVYREYMQDTCDEQNETALQTAIWDAVYASCEVGEPPEEMVDKQYEDLKEYFESYASYYSMDLETFVTTQMNLDMETFEAKNRENAIQEAQNELIYMAIAKAEGINVNDSLMKEVAEEEYSMYGYASADDFMETMGEVDFKSYVMRKKVLERLAEVVTVVENEPVSMFAQ